MSERDLKQSAGASSSEDAIFDDIRPCRDNEVDTELSRICNDEQVIRGLAKLSYPKLNRVCGPLVRYAVRAYIKKTVAHIHNVATFQDFVAQFVKRMMHNTSHGVTFKGFEKLDPKKGYLFISNHRDISLDPAFIDMALHLVHMDTVRIAIGDNLLRMPAATSLMRLNKSFLVKRGSMSPRQKLKEIKHLSEYIGLSLQEGHSIWIAQREGRAKDGNDATELAVLKMLHMHGRALKQDFNDYMSSLNIVPVSITYEYDPGDVSKAKELQERAENDGKYAKGELEDIQSIVDGIKGFKGRISIVAGDVLSTTGDSPEALAYKIDSFIYSNYTLFPSVLLSAEKLGLIDEQHKDMLSTITPDERSFFEARIDAMPENIRQRALQMYAHPFINYCKAKEGTLAAERGIE